MRRYTLHGVFCALVHHFLRHIILSTKDDQLHQPDDCLNMVGARRYTLGGSNAAEGSRQVPGVTSSSK